MAANTMPSSFAFNETGNLFAYIGSDGKLKIWDTSTGVLKQDYTKDLHLSSPCTTLIWLQTEKQHGSRSKVRKSSLNQSIGDCGDIALGTESGNILLYSVATNSVVSGLEGHTSRVNNFCGSVSSNTLYSCSDDKFIIEWDLAKQKLKSKWKTPKEKVKCILELSNGTSLLSASSQIRLWDLSKKQVVQTFTGHASSVVSLLLVPGHSSYFISAARGDRNISVWSLKSGMGGSSALASFLLQDSPTSVHVLSSSEATSITATTESGVLHVFKHKLNGPVKKPIKPTMSVSIATEGSQPKDPSCPVPIHAVFAATIDSVLIAYGSTIFFRFEQLALSDHKAGNVVLVRNEKRKLNGDEYNSKTKSPIIGGDVEYQVAGKTAQKRTRNKQADVPLEDRLENLALAEVAGATLKKDNMAQLLVQGLQSKDQTILQGILFKNDEAVINSTVRHLPIQAVIPLIKELMALLHGKTFTSKVAVHWMAAILRIHSGFLLSNPDVCHLFEPLLVSVEARTAVLAPLIRLRGRVGLVAEQLGSTSHDVDETPEPLIAYVEQDSSDEASDMETSEKSKEDEDWSDYSEMEQDEDDDEK